MLCLSLETMRVSSLRGREPNAAALKGDSSTLQIQWLSIRLQNTAGELP